MEKPSVIIVGCGEAGKNDAIAAAMKNMDIDAVIVSPKEGYELGMKPNNTMIVDVLGTEYALREPNKDPFASSLTLPSLIGAKMDHILATNFEDKEAKEKRKMMKYETLSNQKLTEIYISVVSKKSGLSASERSRVIKCFEKRYKKIDNGNH